MRSRAVSPVRSLRAGFFILTCVLAVLGLLAVSEASVAESFVTFGDPYYFVRQQLIGLALGFTALCVATLIPLKFWTQTAHLWYILGIILLILVFIPGIGLELNGAHRWISLPGLTLQPVEFVKFAMLLFFSVWMTKHQRIQPFLALTAIPAVLIILQPDLGSLLTVLAVSFTMFFISGGNLKQFSLVAAVVIPLIAIAIVTSPYRMQRVTTFLNPQSDPWGASFHIRQITIALGRGGLLGQGIGNSKQRFSYIPEASTDSIFSIIAEEVGFIGSLIVIGLLGLYFVLGWKIVKSHSDPTIQLLGLGILFWFGFQALLNLSAVVALVPLTGIPLPFFSYGRTALIMLLFSTGIIIRIGKEA